MTDAEVLELLQKVGAFRSGHFVFTSGLHADTYVNKDALYPYTRETSRLCREMAERFKDKNIEVVLGPAVAAAVLSQWTAYHLTELTGREVYAVYADKDGKDGFIVRRGYDQLIKGKNVLIVEDLTTTGGSVKQVVDCVRDAGGEVVGVCVMVNRDPENVNSESVGTPFTAAGVLKAEAFDEKDCPFCKQGRPINTKIGHGKKYLEEKGK